MWQRIFAVIAGALMISVSADGQLADEFNSPRANCCLVNIARSLADQLQDWSQLGRYHNDNRELNKEPAEPNRVVFTGRSLLQQFRGFFKNKRDSDLN